MRRVETNVPEARNSSGRRKKEGNATKKAVYLRVAAIYKTAIRKSRNRLELSSQTESPRRDALAFIGAIKSQGCSFPTFFFVFSGKCIE